MGWRCAAWRAGTYPNPALAAPEKPDALTVARGLGGHTATAQPSDPADEPSHRSYHEPFPPEPESSASNEAAPQRQRRATGHPGGFQHVLGSCRRRPTTYGLVRRPLTSDPSCHLHAAGDHHSMRSVVRPRTTRLNAARRSLDALQGMSRQVRRGEMDSYSFPRQVVCLKPLEKLDDESLHQTRIFTSHSVGDVRWPLHPTGGKHESHPTILCSCPAPSFARRGSRRQRKHGFRHAGRGCRRHERRGSRDAKPNEIRRSRARHASDSLGVVLTDSSTAHATATLSATSTCKSFQARHASATFGDGGVDAATAEDRFVGFVSPVGITTFTLSMGVPLKADPLQFGW